MIPEFITAKPATNRNAADALSTPDSNSIDQVQNRAAFQKALHERTADQQAAAADDVRPEESRQSTPARTSTEAATRPSENTVEGGELSKLASETVLPSFVLADDANIGTLPSLIRLPLDDVTVSQLSGDFILLGDTPGGENSGVFVQPSVSSSQNVLDVDPELRPFLDDALIPDAESVATNSQITATEPSLIAGNLQSSPAADNVIFSDAGEEQSAIPTLPSLRPELTTAVSTSPPVETATQDASTPVIENVAGVVVADGILTAVEQSSAVIASNVEPALHEPSDGVAAVDDSPSKELPLILPSLVPGPKRTTEAANNAEDHNFSGEQTSSRKASTQTSEPAAVPEVSKSSLQVPVPPQVEAASLARQNVVADNPQVVEPAARFSGDNANGESKNTASQHPAVPLPVESNVSQPANDVSRRATATLNSDTSTIVEKTAASSSGGIDSEQSATRQAVAERTDAGTAVPAVSERGVPLQPAEVAQTSAGTTQPSEDAVNERQNAGGAIVSPAVNTASRTTQRVSESRDRPALQSLPAPVAAANAVVVEPVPSDSADGLRSERASTPAVDVNEPELRKDRSDPSPIQKAAHAADNTSDNTSDNAVRQSNPARPAVADQGVAEKSAQKSPQHYGEQSAAGASVAASGDQLAAGSQLGPAAPTTVARAAVEPRAGNDSEPSTVTGTSGTSTSQGTQPVSLAAVQPGPVIDVPTGAVVASPSPVSEVGSVSSPSAPVEVQATDVTAVSNVQTAVTSSTAATSNAATRSDVVREPAVPIEIQDAVSAIQEATSGDSHIRVRLNPRELGNMLVDVSRTENGVVARLEVESAAARVAILETLPDLQQSLSRSGSTVDRVEVVLTEARAESGRQESDQSQPREQQSRQERQSSNQQARDEQSQRREQNQRRNQHEDSSSVEDDSSDNETPEQLDIKL